MHSQRVPGSLPSKARGQALLILILMISTAAMLLVYGSSTELTRAIKAEHKTRAVLNYAKQALIGRAIGDGNRPGSLPCPDGDNDGSADLFVGSSCASYIGRLPWRTLGVGDLRDDSGERLWYALSPAFRDHPSAPALNTDTRGTLVVYSNSEATVISREAVAVVFAAGSALGTQVRDATPVQCSTNGRHIPRDRCPANYLDDAGGFNNAAAAGPYVAAPPAARYNDKLAVIVAGDLMPLVEQRVALEVRNALLAYKATAACRCYPWAAGGTDGLSNRGLSRGRIPTVAALPDAWPAGVLPSYFAANDWARVIYYSSSRAALENSGSACTTCVEPTLSVDGASGYDVVLLTSGYAASARERTTLSDYIDDLENRNGDDQYVTPASPASDRDRLYAITGPAAGCAANARVLAQNAPCGSPESALRPACRSAAAALERCGCATAAGVIMKAPCTSTLSATQCDTAMSQLRACIL